MALTGATLRVLLVRDRDRDMGVSMADGFTAAGCAVSTCERFRPETWSVAQGRFDLLVAYGPHQGSILPALDILRRCAAPQPRFVWWLNENAPDIKRGPITAALRAELRYFADRAVERFFGRPWMNDVTTQSRLVSFAHRDRVYGELRHLMNRRRVDLLAVTSERRCDWLKKRGFRAAHISMGYDPRFGQDLQTPRDIDVLFLGTVGDARRGSILQAIERELKLHGRSLVIEDGRNGYVNLEARTQLMNRVKVLVNVLKSPTDFTGHRVLIGVANRALVVSEPMLDSDPFKPQRHFVAAPPDQLGRTIVDWLERESEREAFTASAYADLTTRLTMTQMCRRVLEAATPRQAA